MFSFSAWLSAAALLATLVSGSASAVSISYEATDLPDVVPGLDRWSIAYSLSGSFDAFAGVNILYPSGEFSELDLVSPPDPANWGALVVQPDPGLVVAGLVSVTPFNSTVANNLPFVVTFNRLVPSLPGSQNFEVFDPSFSIVDTGATTPLAAVPEPEAWAMALVGLVLVGVRARRRRRTLVASRTP